MVHFTHNDRTSRLRYLTGDCTYMLRLIYLNGYLIGPHHDQTPIQNYEDSTLFFDSPKVVV